MVLSNDFSADLFTWGEPIVRSDIIKLKNRAQLVGWALFGTIFLTITLAGFAEFASRGEIAALPVALFCSLVTFGSFVMLRMTWRRRNDWVAVFEQGVGGIYHGETIRLAWDEFATIRQNIQTIRVNLIPFKIRQFTLKTHAGKQYLFDNNLKSIEVAGLQMQRQIVAKRIPIVMSAFKSGERQTFGHLTIDQFGIQRRKQQMSWDEFDGTTINNGILTIRKKGKRLGWANVALNKVPNAFVLHELLERITQSRHA